MDKKFLWKKAIAFFFLCLLGQLVVAAETLTIASGESLYIGAGNTDYEGVELVVAGELVMDGYHHLSALRVLDGGVVTHSAGSELGLDIKAGEVTIDNGGRIDVSAKGRLPKRLDWNFGGSYGGRGGCRWQRCDELYGSYGRPFELGSGGASEVSGLYSRGGGKVRIIADAIVLNGRILSKGEKVEGGASGSGGAIWLDVNDLYIEKKIGALDASGETGGLENRAGGGGGGRISIHYNNIYMDDMSASLDEVAIEKIAVARGGDRSSYISYWQISSDGTLHFLDKKNGGEYIYYVGGSEGSVEINYSFGGTVKAFDSDVNMGDGSKLTGKLYFGRYSEDRYRRFVFSEKSIVKGEIIVDRKSEMHIRGSRVQPASVIVNSGAILVLPFDAEGERYFRFETLRVKSGGIVTFYNYEISDQIVVKSKNVFVDKGGVIEASGAGFWSERPGREGYAGASYGGLGGYDVDNPTNPIYGESTLAEPFLFGASGGGFNTDWGSGFGGGVVKIVTESLVVDGEIRVDGNDGLADENGWASGGSGGSVWIDAETISGEGLISASGGSAEIIGGGGGGGRIALHARDFSDFDAANQVKADPGASINMPPAEAGTVYVNNKVDSFRVLGIDLDGTGVGMGAWISDYRNYIHIEFSKPVDESTFTSDDIELYRGDAVDVPVSIEKKTSTRFKVVFQDEFNQGNNYFISIYGDINSIFGDYLDQDRDGNGNEPDGDDRFEKDVPIFIPPPEKPFLVDGLNNGSILYLNIASFELKGVRENPAAIILNDEEVAPFNSGEWLVSLNLNEGANSFEIKAVDQMGRQSDPVQISLVVDLNAPGVDFPVSDSAEVYSSPLCVALLNDSGIGVDPQSIVAEISRNGILLGGEYQFESSTGCVNYTPSSSFIEGSYAVTIEALDKLGNRLAPTSGDFVIDLTPPSKPEVAAYPSVVNVSSVLLSGSKEADSSITINNETKVQAGAGTSWSLTVPLTLGDNFFEIRSQDSVGNLSEPTHVQIRYDNQVPGPVAFTIDPDGNGTSVVLDWSGYDLEGNGGDISHFTIYRSPTPFSALEDPGVSTVRTVGGGESWRQPVTGLARNTPVYLAVVAVDVHGSQLDSFSSQATTPNDIEPPEAAGGFLQVTPEETALALTWQASGNGAGDLVGYRLYWQQGGQEQSVDVAHTGTASVSHTLTGLTPRAGHPLRLVAFDADGNESVALTNPGVTLLDHPTGLQAEPFSGRATLSWQAHPQPELLHRYDIYVSTQPFSSVAGMSPRHSLTNVNATQFELAGLENGTTHYVAITAINRSNGERDAVMPVEVTPQADSEPPELTAVQYRNNTGLLPLVNNLILKRSGTLEVSANDPSGIDRVSWSLDGQALGTVTTASGGLYKLGWDLKPLVDGAHQLEVTVYDTYNNSLSQSFTLDVQLDPPSAPAITSHSDGQRSNSPQQTLSGTSETGTIVRLLQSGQTLDTTAITSASGHWSLPVTLAEGENGLVVEARYSNRNAWAGSAAINLVLDTNQPDMPTGVQALSRAGGEVQLSWSAVGGGTELNPVVGYNIYRDQAPIADSTALSPINGSLVKSTHYTDLPAEDGHYYYRIAAVNQLASQSALSRQIESDSDRSQPVLEEVSYESTGPVISGRHGPGQVQVLARFSESLAGRPFVSINPEQGLPITLELRPLDAANQEWQGEFEIRAETGSGRAVLGVSARDRVGNIGNQVAQGNDLVIDTDGPAITELGINPTAPVPVDGGTGAPVDVLLRLNDDPVAEPALTLVPQLDGEVIAGYESGLLLQKDGSSQPGAPLYTARLQLPVSAGLDDGGQPAAESLTFVYSAADDLGNLEQQAGIGGFQVYQGDLPPLDTPAGLTVKLESGGSVLARWQAVTDAVGYRLYRSPEEQSGYGQVAELGGADLEFFDTPPSEGDWYYRVVSLRRANGQERESAPSEPRLASADATAPGVPQLDDIEVNGAGLVLRWVAAEQDAAGQPETGPLQYQIYRLGLPEGSLVTSGDLQGVEPLQTEIPEPYGLDPRPSPNEHAYVIVALDPAGNRSEPSNLVYKNLGLVPASDLQLSLPPEGAPTLSWNHSGGDIDGFNIYRGHGESARLAAQVGPAARSWQDTDFQRGSDQWYSVRALDNDAAVTESVEASIRLPALVLNIEAPEQGPVLKRGVMNRLRVRVDNLGSEAVDGLQLKVTTEAGAVSQTENRFNVPAGASVAQELIVGGSSNLGGGSVQERLTLKLQRQPYAGQMVTLQSEHPVTVGDGALQLRLLAGEMTRGASGSARIELSNTSDTSVEIVTARSAGRNDSNEVRFVLEDADGNRLARQPIRITSGDGVQLSANGDHMVARIAPGATYLSEPVSMSVPAAAPDQVVLRLEVDHYRYHTGRASAVTIQGGSAWQSVTLLDTPYYVADVVATPALAFDGESITFTGEARRRSDDQPLAQAPVKVVVEVDGFERSFSAVSDNAGQVSFAFEPQAGTAGQHWVSLVHPEATARPRQAQFVLQTAGIAPKRFNVSLPRNMVRSLPLKISAGAATELQNVRLQLLDDFCQGPGTLPTGLSVTFSDGIAVPAASNRYINLAFRGDAQALVNDVLCYRVLADTASGERLLGEFKLNYELVDAQPALVFSPNALNTGVSQGQLVTEVITIQNKGFAALENPRFELLNDQLQPALPNWIQLSSSGAGLSLAPGETMTVEITAAPDSAVADRSYEFVLRVSADNLPEQTRGVWVNVSQDGVGSAAFRVADIYTGTPRNPEDLSQGMIPGLAGATVKLDHETLIDQHSYGTTNANGELYLDDLVPGRYSYRAYAPNHETSTGRIWVKPGVQASEDVFLVNNLVTVEWEVNEIVLEDRYEIRLEATYETQVPVAVVGLDPLVVNLPVMRKGEEIQGELRLTNHGLIRADNVRASLPSGNQYIEIEFLGAVPETLAPTEVFYLPYRVTALRDFNPVIDGTSAVSGGGCGSFSETLKVNYQSQCANGTVLPSSTQTRFHSGWGSNCGGSGGGGGSSSYDYSYGGGGGGVSYTPRGSGIGGGSGQICQAPPQCEEGTCGNGNGTGR